MFTRTPFSSMGVSPPNLANYRSESFSPSSTNGSGPTYSTSPTAQRHHAARSNGIAHLPHLASSTSDPSAFETRLAPSVLIRKLPRTTTIDTLKNMLIFTNDLIDVDFVGSSYAEDLGYHTAVATFQTAAGALEAQQKLDGKPNSSKEANMIVEIHSSGMGGHFERRNTIDGVASGSRTQSSSTSSGGSGIAPLPRSRFGSTFQSSEKVSPPLPTPSTNGSGEFPIPENSSHIQSMFSPQSPLANGVDGHHRVSGKSMINDDSADDDTGDLLKDPVAYARNGQQPIGRRQTQPQIPITRFGNLSLSTTNGYSNDSPSTASSGALTSPRGASSAHSTMSPMSPGNMTSMGPNGAAYMPQYTRSQYPPANPADQNPPCNTLYVGNLPIDTSEDELKSVFSKQRGYKRLCFRTKQNGPMCFVEFEDVSFATKALHELYGHPLHNSVKGGIRLSFSKNPLGVRSGQPNGLGPNSIMSPQAMAPGFGSAAGGNTFSSVSGPPPGLASPPGLATGPYRSPPAGMDGMFSNPFNFPSQDYLSPRQYSSGVPSELASGTFGRDMHGSHGDYFGR